MENNNKKNLTDKEQRELGRDLASNSGTTGDNLFNPRNAATNNEVYPNERRDKQTNEEIAEQGFTVRDGHNPNKPNPYEGQVDKDVSELNIEFQKGKGLNVEELASNGDIKFENDELDNPSDPPVEDFQETEDILEDIDEDETDDRYDDQKRGDKYPKDDPRILE